MRVGIDLGTTRTVIASVDRGNYPVLSVEDATGDLHEHIPTVVGLDGDDLLCGWEALAADAGRGEIARSFKRLLSLPDATGATPVRIGARERSLAEVMNVFAAHVIAQIRRSTRCAADEPIEVVLGVPAHAHSAQRLLTLDAFARAGATVLGLVNEPSAGAFEFTHRHPRSVTSRRTAVVVYDLGGGTFDASVVRVDGTDHVVERSIGIPHLGGDDFDAVLAHCAVRAAADDTADGARARIDPSDPAVLDAARLAKERVLPQTRRMLIELEDADAMVSVADFYDAATPLVEQTLEAMGPLVASSALAAADEAATSEEELAGIYLVGGAAALPLVGRMLRQEFGRRVHRSPYPSASTAIGLAIAADPDSGYRLRDRISRGIGVFREAQDGREVTFDPLVPPGAAPQADGSLSVTRHYRAAHNVGWFRYVEFPATDGLETSGDLTALAQVVVPFDPALRDGRDLSRVQVERRGDGPWVEETVHVDANGITTIRLTLEDGYTVETSAL